MEWFAELKVELQVRETLNVRDPRGVVVRIVPRPRSTTVVVIVQIPLQGSHVAMSLFQQNRVVNLGVPHLLDVIVSFVLSVQRI